MWRNLEYSLYRVCMFDVPSQSKLLRKDYSEIATSVIWYTASSASCPDNPTITHIVHSEYIAFMNAYSRVLKVNFWEAWPSNKPLGAPGGHRGHWPLQSVPSYSTVQVECF